VLKYGTLATITRTPVAYLSPKHEPYLLNNFTAAEHQRTLAGTQFAYSREEGQAESAWLVLW